MKTSEIYELLRQYQLKTAGMKDSPTVRFETEVALKLGYYVDWDKMVHH